MTTMNLPASQIIQLEILGAMLLSLLLGGLIGYERETANKPAGLRTHMLVAAAVTLIVDLGDIVIAIFSQETAGSQVVQADPIRIIEAVTAGISFLGAGTILRRTDAKTVEGLTTAASILFTAAIGISVALSQFIIAIGGTIVALIILRLVQVLESRLRETAEDVMDSVKD